ncbi:MAG: hypothetical protein ACTSYC_07645 [Promethearchaeota archaeon]
MYFHEARTNYWHSVIQWDEAFLLPIICDDIKIIFGNELNIIDKVN